MSEHILWETIKEQKQKITELEKESRLLGERCNQLLKDKGYLTDKLQELKEILAQTIENDEVAYETLKLHDQEEIGMLNSKVTELENKIADIKANCDLAIEGREVKIMELEQQIEKIKCCENCKYNSYWGNELHCNYGLKEAIEEDKLVECNKMNKWEIKENE